MKTGGLQFFIYKLEVGSFSRVVWATTLAVMVLAFGFWYDMWAYRGFAAPEAMDAAQVARNLAEGRGYTTDFLRPFSLYLMRKHSEAQLPGQAVAPNADPTHINQPHPDLANAPVYPVVLAGLMKVLPMSWKTETKKPFWSESGRFLRFKPEFYIAIFNQMLLLMAVWLTFLIARIILDWQSAWLAALLMLGSDLLWKFSVSGLSTMLLLVVFLSLVLCLTHIEQLGRAKNPSRQQLLWLAVLAGILVGIGMLTRYSFGVTILPVVFFLMLFGPPRQAAEEPSSATPMAMLPQVSSHPKPSSGMAVTAFLAFAFVIAPWIGRNLMVSGTYFGTAGYAAVEGTHDFPGSQLMQSQNPNLASAYYMTTYAGKLLGNLRSLIQGDLLRLGGSWVSILFFGGLLLGLRNLAASRLRFFTLMCLVVFMFAQALGRTQLSNITPEINSENLLVLLAPLVAIFGVAFFMTLLRQMEFPTLEIRYWVIVLLVVVACLPLITTLMPPKASPVVYPPYYPPEIQKVSDWMQQDELMMSDIPWAVAWYGRRQCLWTTINAKYEFFALNDNLAKPIRALYLTLITLDGKLFSECLQGSAESWGNFVLKSVAFGQIPPGFPLRVAPYGLMTGLFLTDRQRWQTE